MSSEEKPAEEPRNPDGSQRAGDTEGSASGGSAREVGDREAAAQVTPDRDAAGQAAGRDAAPVAGDATRHQAVAADHPSPDADPHDDEENPAEPEMVTGKDRGKRMLRAGVFAAIGLVLLLVGVFVIGGKQNLFSSTIPLYTTFQTVEGLKSGAPVMMSGIKIGTVANVVLQLDTGTSVRVDMVLDGEYQEFLRTSTYATIGQAGLIGDKLIELRVRDAAAPQLEPNSRIESVPPPNYTAIIDEARESVKNAENITASLDTLFMRFRRGEGTLGKLITDERAYESMLRLTLSAEQLFDRTNQQIVAVGGSVDKAAFNVEQMTAAGRDLMVDVSRGKGSIGALMYDRSLYDSLESLTGTLTEAAESAGFAAREFGLNMRGLRNNWLVGGLFGGGEEVENVELLAKQLQIREEELRRQGQLLEQREKQILEKERDADTEISKK